MEVDRHVKIMNTIAACQGLGAQAVFPDTSTSSITSSMSEEKVAKNFLVFSEFRDRSSTESIRHILSYVLFALERCVTYTRILPDS